MSEATEPHDRDDRAETKQEPDPVAQAAAAQPPGQSPLSTRPDMSTLVQTLAHSGTPKDVEALLGSETNQDHILGNLESEEVWERKWDIENNEEFVLAMFPPEESVLQGEVRKLFDLPAPYSPVAPTTLHNIEDTKWGAFARTTRSRGGWQQKILTEQVQEIRSVDGQQEDEEGLIDRFLGGGR